MQLVELAWDWTRKAPTPCWSFAMQWCLHHDFHVIKIIEMCPHGMGGGGGGGGGWDYGMLNSRLGSAPSFACASLLAQVWCTT